MLILRMLNEMWLSGVCQVWGKYSLRGGLHAKYGAAWNMPGMERVFAAGGTAVYTRSNGVDEGTCCDEDVYRLDGRQVVPPVTGSLSV